MRAMLSLIKTDEDLSKGPNKGMLVASVSSVNENSLIEAMEARRDSVFVLE
jgi:hypothetical protein